MIVIARAFHLFHLSSSSLVITFYVIWIMTSQHGHGIVTKLKIMQTFGLIWLNWLKIGLLICLLIGLQNWFPVLDMVAIATD